MASFNWCRSTCNSLADSKLGSLLGSFWGRRGTYGVVLSATVKFHPAVTWVSSATLQFASPTTSDGIASYWSSIKVFLQALPLMVDSGLQIVWTIAPRFFLVSPVTGLDVPQATIDILFSKTLATLEAAEIPYKYASTVSTSFLTYYESAVFGANVSNYNIGGRLIPRSVMQNSSDSFFSVFKQLLKTGILWPG
ncbi:hypothetical protein sscle_13g093360 [Sclerotinia sclerotiorum 1980 UF-70]|uniref:FAD linked oxidase N-terminal domain-containing protein n=1 Tax=Sclerotinia sclerotiorum (strain ATCC 18683 / 1980 / Ss-1) TaxID=665079 RepID=A0A1D9QI15_SCLS1|nr:hypothetical protein sscle_13g093360 [Sclerotinia sclerotiorum 1980 UF-70]